MGRKCHFIKTLVLVVLVQGTKLTAPTPPIATFIKEV